MSLVAIVGEVSTTSATALALGWPAGGQVVLVEADPSGGDLAAWFDLPTTPGLASAVSAAPTASWPVVSDHLQHAHGVDVLVAPGRAGDAEHAVDEAGTRLVPTFAALEDVTVIADCGRAHIAHLSPFVLHADLVLVTVRPSAASDRAAAVHLDRHGELVDALAARGLAVTAMVVAGGLYNAAEVAAFLGGPAGPLPVVELADDPAGAMVIAGRAGSRRGVERSPLLRSASAAALTLARQLAATVGERVR